MSDLNLWLDNSDSPSVKVTVDEGTLVSRLRIEMIAQSSLPRIRPDGKLMTYDLVCVRTGTILMGDNTPISYLAEYGDHFLLRPAFANPVSETSIKDIKEADAVPTGRPSVDVPGSQRNNWLTVSFSITGVAPFYLDLDSEYLVLAIRFRYSYAGRARTTKIPGLYGALNPLSSEEPIYAKDIYFLMADEEGKFRWVSPKNSSLFLPGVSKTFPDHDNHQLTRYSLAKVGECKNMIYPVRPFSITGISLEGFDSGKEYAVLAIDIDQYINEKPQSEEDNQEEQPASQSVAFFLVGDDNGEFAWIAEDECRLFPLKS